MRAGFTGDLVLKAVPPDEWVVVYAFKYCTFVKGGRPSFIKVPVGERTDLASIPRSVRFFISQNGRHRAAAVVHDRLYKQAGLNRYTRKQCDDVFREAMKVSGVPWWKREMMYAGVRAGGWVVYNKYKKANT